MTVPDRSLIYIGDPLCSWCWGFSDVMRQLEQRFVDRLPVVAIMGGLRPGPSAEPLNERMQTFLRHHWEEVHSRTGQPVNYDFLDENEGLLMDTEIPCRAVVAFRSLNEPQALSYFRRVQLGMFAENRSAFDSEILADLAAELGADRQRFLEEFGSQEAKDTTAADFEFARQLGVNGFPSLMVKDATGYRVATHGYRPLADLVDPLEQWLADSVDSHEAN